MGEPERGAGKKLIGLALAWTGLEGPPEAAGRFRVDAGVVASMRQMGCTDEQIEGWRAAMADREPAAAGVDALGVHEDAWTAWQFFVAVDSQWRWSPAAGLGGGKPVRLGLRYADCEAELRQGGWPRRARAGLWQDMKLLEAAVLDAQARVAQGQRWDGAGWVVA